MLDKLTKYVCKNPFVYLDFNKEKMVHIFVVHLGVQQKSMKPQKK